MEYFVKGMGCAGCARTIEKKLNELPEVIEATVDFSSKKATVKTHNNVSLDTLQQALAGTHYSLSLTADAPTTSATATKYTQTTPRDGILLPYALRGQQDLRPPRQLPRVRYGLSTAGKPCPSRRARRQATPLTTAKVAHCDYLYASYFYNFNGGNVARESSLCHNAPCLLGLGAGSAIAARSVLQRSYVFWQSLEKPENQKLQYVYPYRHRSGFGLGAQYSRIVFSTILP